MASHGTQELFPIELLNVPALQATQEKPFTSYPAAQEHDDEPGAEARRGPHTRQAVFDVAPTADEDVPSGQGVHVELSVLSLYVPAAQGTHTVPFSSKPGLQEQKADPAVELEFAVQLKHDDEPSGEY